eukprot:GHVN01047856.1.p3 GENE.GHVN01047856.1~~GHVN01047856.1.p3  ORF type:complete len:107 (+),score=35.88 GHVN01047856.1:206-526(+)
MHHCASVTPPHSPHLSPSPRRPSLPTSPTPQIAFAVFTRPRPHSARLHHSPHSRLTHSRPCRIRSLLTLASLTAVTSRPYSNGCVTRVVSEVSEDVERVRVCVNSV